MTVLFTRRFVAVALIAASMLALGAIAIFGAAQPTFLGFEVRQVTARSPDEALVTVSMKNLSNYSVQYMSAGTDYISPLCIFVQTTGAGERTWASPASRSSRFLSPGEEVVVGIPIPRNGPVRIGVLMRRLPHMKWTDNTALRKARMILFTVRSRIALRQKYRPCWLPQPVSATPPAAAETPPQLKE